MKKFLALASVILVLSACGSDPSLARADYETAVRYLRGQGVPQDQKKGTDYLEKAAKEGSPDAELALGFSYLKGRGVEKDSVKAFKLFVSAADQGDIDAEYNVGLAYVKGEGTEKDMAKAAEWFEKSALSDDAGSQYNLGVMYLNGEGVKTDPLTAFAWFKLASDKNYEGAIEGMDMAKKSLTKDQIGSLNQEVAKLSRRIKRTARVNIPGGRDQGANQPL